MSRLASVGFETGGVPMVKVGSPSVTSSDARTGTYALQVASDNGGAYVNLGVSRTELYARVAYKPSTGGDNYPCLILWFANSASKNMLVLGFASHSQTIGVYRTENFYDFGLLASGSSLLLDTWYLIEMHVTEPADSGGVAEVKIDGVMDIEFEGDTLGYYTPADYQHVGIGWSNMSGGLYSHAAKGLYDDFAVNDTLGTTNNSWCGRGGIYPALVSGAGDLAQFTPSAGSNYECVDEVPPNDDTDYVSTAAEGNIDTYAIDVPDVSGGVPVVTLWHYAKLDEAGAGNITQLLRTGSVNYEGDLKGLDTSYKHVAHSWEQNPATSQPWTLAALESFQIGQKAS